MLDRTVHDIWQRSVKQPREHNEKFLQEDYEGWSARLHQAGDISCKGAVIV
jgi:hypothetical protein